MTTISGGNSRACQVDGHSHGPVQLTRPQRQPLDVREVSGQHLPLALRHVDACARIAQDCNQGQGLWSGSLPLGRCALS